MLNEKLGYRKVSARRLYRVLTPDNKRDRLQYSKAMLEIYRNSDLKRLDKTVTGDRTLVYRYEPPRKS